LPIIDTTAPMPRVTTIAGVPMHVARAADSACSDNDIHQPRQYKFIWICKGKAQQCRRLTESGSYIVVLFP